MILDKYEFVKPVPEGVQLPPVFSDEDLHPRNIALNDENNEVMFLDLEITGFNNGFGDLSYLPATKFCP